MKVSDRGLAFIAGHEGVVPYPYRDSVGVWTFGIGHTASAGAPNPAGMTRGVERPLEEVFATFRRDIEKFEARVNAAVKVPLAQHEFDALVSFDFNTGGIHRAKLTGHLNAGNKAKAADAFMGWSKPAAIVPRRKAEQALFRNGSYGEPKANIYPADAQGRILWSKAKRIDVLAAMGGSQTPPAPQPTPKPDIPVTDTPERSKGTSGAVIFIVLLIVALAAVFGVDLTELLK